MPFLQPTLICALRIFAACCDLLVIATIVEQLIWEGESNSLVPWLLIVTPILFGFLLALNVRNGSRAPIPLTQLSPLSVLFTIVLALATLLIEYQMRAYHWLYAEPVARLNLDEVAALFALISLAAASKRQKFGPVRSIPIKLGVLLGFFLICWNITFPAHTMPFASHGQLYIAVGFLVIGLRAQFSSSACTNHLVFRLERGAVLLLLALVFGLLLQGATLIFSSALPQIANYPYRVPKGFATQLLVSEDPIFAFHQGVDLKRLRDAVRELLEHGEYRRGGSTLTMQLAKIRYLSAEKTITRKLSQISCAFWLELIYGKERLAWEYIDSVPFAQNVHGLKAAAKHFYGVEPEQLSLDQALTLVLSIYDPATFNPGVVPKPSVVLARERVISSRNKAQANQLLTQIAKLSFVY